VKKIDEEVALLIPISVSVKQLDEQFEWLRDLVWNSKSDEEDSEVEEKKEDK